MSQPTPPPPTHHHHHAWGNRAQTRHPTIKATHLGLPCTYQHLGNILNN